MGDKIKRWFHHKEEGEASLYVCVGTSGISFLFSLYIILALKNFIHSNEFLLVIILFFTGFPLVFSFVISFVIFVNAFLRIIKDILFFEFNVKHHEYHIATLTMQMSLLLIIIVLGQINIIPREKEMQMIVNEIHSGSRRIVSIEGRRLRADRYSIKIGGKNGREDVFFSEDGYMSMYLYSEDNQCDIGFADGDIRLNYIKGNWYYIYVD